MNTNDQVKTLVQIQKSLARGKAGNLAENKAFLDFLRIQAEMTKQIDETWDIVKEKMIEHDIQKIDGEWGYITMAERKTFSGSAAPRFMKKVLDTAKVKAYSDLYHGKLPEGVKLSTTRFLQKKVKLA